MQLCTRRRSSTPSDSSPTDELGRKQFLYRRRTLVNLARSEQRIRVERLAPVDDGVALAHPLEVVDEFVDRRVRDLDLVDATVERAKPARLRRDVTDWESGGRRNGRGRRARVVGDGEVEK